MYSKSNELLKIKWINYINFIIFLFSIKKKKMDNTDNIYVWTSVTFLTYYFIWILKLYIISTLVIKTISHKILKPYKIYSIILF